MQTKQTARLSKKIRRLREKKRKGKQTPWRVVCETLNIRTEDGRVDPGLAFRIGYQEYEPSDRALRQRLRLKDICTKCKRSFRLPLASALPIRKSTARIWWDKLKREDKERLIEISYRNYLDWRNRKS